MDGRAAGTGGGLTAGTACPKDTIIYGNITNITAYRQKKPVCRFSFPQIHEKAVG